MEQNISDYISQRMTEMGYDKYHWEAIRIKDESGTKTINAYNEFYFLIAKVIEPDLVIISDTHIFNEANAYSNFTFYNFQEFSGSIQINQGNPIDYEFIRAVPE